MSGVLQFQSGPSIPNDIVILHTGDGFGSSSNKIRKFTTIQQNTGTAITYNSGSVATLGATFTINVTGIYAIEYTDLLSSAACVIGISVNSNQLTTSIASITDTTRLNLVTTPAATAAGFVSATVRLSAGDIVRPHTDGTPDGPAPSTRFKISRVA